MKKVNTFDCNVRHFHVCFSSLWWQFRPLPKRMSARPPNFCWVFYSFFYIVTGSVTLSTDWKAPKSVYWKSIFNGTITNAVSNKNWRFVFPRYSPDQYSQTIRLCSNKSQLKTRCPNLKRLKLIWIAQGKLCL